MPMIHDADTEAAFAASDTYEDMADNLAEEYGPLATETDAVREWAWNFGAEHPERAWLCSNYDTWERNPHYRGPRQPHPEEEGDGIPFFEEGEAPGPKWEIRDSTEDIPF